MIRDFNISKQALQRLESIDNSNPSKVLELVSYLKDYHLNTIPYQYWLDDIEQYILKAQEQEKMLNIIKEHLTFEDSGTEEYFDFKTNQKVKKYIFKIESKDTGATIHIHLDSPEYFNLLKEMLK